MLNTFLKSIYFSLMGLALIITAAGFALGGVVSFVACKFLDWYDARAARKKACEIEEVQKKGPH